MLLHYCSNSYCHSSEIIRIHSDTVEWLSTASLSELCVCDILHLYCWLVCFKSHPDTHMQFWLELLARGESQRWCWVVVEELECELSRKLIDLLYWSVFSPSESMRAVEIRGGQQLKYSKREREHYWLLSKSNWKLTAVTFKSKLTAATRHPLLSQIDTVLWRAGGGASPHCPSASLWLVEAEAKSGAHNQVFSCMTVQRWGKMRWCKDSACLKTRASFLRHWNTAAP